VEPIRRQFRDKRDRLLTKFRDRSARPAGDLFGSKADIIEKHYHYLTKNVAMERLIRVYCLVERSLWPLFAAINNQRSMQQFKSVIVSLGGKTADQGCRGYEISHPYPYPQILLGYPWIYPYL